jgi:hypothetical protein
MHKKMAALAAIAAFAGGLDVASAQQSAMTFFVTSQPSGKGADFGGLAGADAFCQTLAAAAGAGGKTWHAYLSTQAAGGTPAVNAKDRIGKGPWQNAKGIVIAKDVADLHGASNNLNKQTALTEKGEVVKGRGDQPNQHDMLTGTKPDGTAFPPGDDKTCANWTSSGAGAAVVGHHDRQGLPPPVPPEEAQSWNSSHLTQGCSAEVLPKTGGNGYLYCFATN